MNSKLSMREVVEAMLKLQIKGEKATILGVGPMSKNCVQASLEVSNELDFPIMFIASRNQVDTDELGGGYVQGWNQYSFIEAVKGVATDIDYKNMYYICRDHGGPWQRDNERNDHIEYSKAMDLAKKSYYEDIKSGFDLLMIDPTKDPFEIGKVIPIESVIERTIELIDYCEKVRLELGKPEIGYEVGTEETNGGLTTTEKYEYFINELNSRLEEKNLPTPIFIVGQTGTLTRKTEQIGTFNFKNASALALMAAKYNVGLKEHNGDYLDDVTLLEHIPTNIVATNVAPQYGTYETRAYLNLVKVEEKLLTSGQINECSKVYEALLDTVIECERWRKWMVDDQKDITIEEIKKDSELQMEILDIAGHYNFNNQRVIDEITKLYENLNSCGIDGNRYVVDYIKRPIRDYSECYNLRGLTTKVKNV